jgi:hypothetical protein
MEQTKLNTKKELIACRLNDTGNRRSFGSVFLGEQENEPGFGMESQDIKSLAEYRKSGTPGDWMRLSNARSFFINNHVLAWRSHVIMTGASFWYFLR